MRLKEIALELLQLYVNSEISMIYEYSGNFDESLDRLYDEADRYKREIEDEAGRLERMLTSQ